MFSKSSADMLCEDIWTISFDVLSSISVRHQDGVGWDGGGSASASRSSNSGRGVFGTRTAYSIASLCATGEGAAMLEWSNMQETEACIGGIIRCPWARNKQLRGKTS